MRGKHAPPHKTPDKDEVFIKEHILKYNPHISHYRREHAPNRLYLPTELSCMDMHKDYLLDCEEAVRKPYSYVKYWRVAKTMYISFASLGIEECETCNSFTIHREEINNQGDDVACVVRKKSRKTLKNNDLNAHGFCEQDCCICNNYKIHNKEAKKAREEYTKDKERASSDTSTLYLSSGLQKVILLPRVPGYKSSIFTSRLITFNMTFALIGLRVIWAGNCGGQNKCWTLYTMLMLFKLLN